MDMIKYKVLENDNVKMLRSEEVNYNFNKGNGYMETWGKRKEDDPDYSPMGPFILDIEVTTICKGVPGKDGIVKPCPFCYKGNNPVGANMSFETFKGVIDRMKKSNTLCQLAFGADSEATSNPDLFKMAEYAREVGVVPNITVANVSNEVADKLVNVMGAVAVSRYDNKNVCYDSVKKLTDRGMKQVNIHILVSLETYDNVMETLKDRMVDERLSKLNAIVMLSLKRKGRGVGYTPLPQDKYNELIKFAMDNNISFGMDSCSAHKFLNAVKDDKNYDKLKVLAEPCESSCFSSYVGVDGKFYPCSFAEGEGEWKDGIDILSVDNFNEVWNNDKVKKFRENLIKGGRKCPLYEV